MTLIASVAFIRESKHIGQVSSRDKAKRNKVGGLPSPTDLQFKFGASLSDASQSILSRSSFQTELGCIFSTSLADWEGRSFVNRRNKRSGTDFWRGRNSSPSWKWRRVPTVHTSSRYDAFSTGGYFPAQFECRLNTEGQKIVQLLVAGAGCLLVENPIGLFVIGPPPVSRTLLFTVTIRSHRVHAAAAVYYRRSGLFNKGASSVPLLPTIYSSSSVAIFFFLFICFICFCWAPPSLSWKLETSFLSLSVSLGLVSSFLVLSHPAGTAVVSHCRQTRQLWRGERNNNSAECSLAVMEQLKWTAIRRTNWIWMKFLIFLRNAFILNAWIERKRGDE